MVGDGKQSQSQAIANCLCWNQTSDNWCHHPLDGHHKGFWRDSCARVAYWNTWWVIPMILWCIYLAVLPVLMAFFRLCCNCCGGRNPSYGACCPIKNDVVSADPNFERKYTRNSTNMAKILALCAFFAFLAVSIHTFIKSSDVNQSVMNIASTVTMKAGNYQTEVAQMTKTVEKLAKEDPMWMNAATRQAVLSKISTTVPTIDQVLKDSQKAHKDDTRNREIPTRVFVAIPLTMFFIVTLLAMCNVRSWPISISAGLLSFFTIVMVLAASITFAAYIVTDFVCDNSKDLTKLGMEVASSEGYCNSSLLNNAVNNTQKAFADYACRNLKLGEMLDQDAKCFCEGTCRFQSTIRSGESTPYITVNADLIMASISGFAKSTIRSTKSDSTWSILSCSNSEFCPLHKEAKEFVQYAPIILATSNTVGTLSRLMSLNRNCYIIDEQMVDTVVPQICHDYRQFPTPGAKLNKNLRVLANCLWTLCVIATVTFWVWMNGAKRFTKGVRPEELLAPHTVHEQAVYGYNTVQSAEAQQAPQPVFEKQSAPLPTTAAVAGTAQQPLLLNHQAPSYAQQNGAPINGTVIA